MKRILLMTCALAALLVSSCTKVQEKSFQTPDGESLFYASIEASVDTRAYADENLRVLWDANDRVSIFNRYTLNEQFRFTGETGDNSGWFEPLPQEAFGTGNELDLVYAVYPYRQSTSISNSGILTVELPDYQVYRQDSFGLGANTMVSATEDNHLLFRNACGYLVLKLYGKDVKVSSITLYGSFEEPIAGKAQVKMTPDGVPELKMGSEAATRVTLTCPEPVALGATPNEAVEFWFALAPVTFEKGFYVEVTDSEGQTHIKFTKNTIEVPRNRKVTMSTISLVWPPVDPSEAVLLPGVFTDANGRKLRISKGNLQAVLDHGVITKWQFAEHQWDTVGDISKLTDEMGVVDQFLYSTTAPKNRWGTHGGVETYLPWLYDYCNPNWESLMEQYYDEYFNRYLEECQIGSYQPQWMNPDLVAEYGAGWELLDLYDVAMSLDHEEYLGHGGTERYYNAHCTPASIEGNRGLVIFPDNYVQPEGIPLNRIEQIIYSGSSGNLFAYPAISLDQTIAYTASQWAEMELAGAVFMPKGLYKRPYDGFDDSFFSQPSLTSFQFEVGDLLFNSHTGPECPDMIRLVKYLD